MEASRGEVAAGRFTQHVVVNAATLVNMRTDAELKESVQSCDIINSEGMGMGVVLGARLLGHAVPERVASVDLIHELLAMSACNGFTVFLLGATGDVVAAAARKVQALYLQLKIAGYHHGYFWDDEAVIFEMIPASGAHCCLSPLPRPRKKPSSTAGGTS
ncbi:MAG: WecB/TagA/CpsF family glycosyltransferase [Rhodoferax sp.]|nr:WecB/TagA/CpsF family glycosyltransferase [Rhodoferax sp.]MDD3934899.1 WecB/TagA/CpsF family glycosyltransferase [Rhodoferax sp.]